MTRKKESIIIIWSLCLIVVSILDCFSIREDSLEWQFSETVRICWLRTLSARPVALTTLILSIPILILVVLWCFCSAVWLFCKMTVDAICKSNLQFYVGRLMYFPTVDIVFQCPRRFLFIREAILVFTSVQNCDCKKTSISLWYSRKRRYTTNQHSMLYLFAQWSLLSATD